MVEAPEGLDMPNETARHLAVYRNRPDLLSVIHAHPDWAVALMASDATLMPMYRAYNPPSFSLCLEDIPIYPSTVTITNHQLGSEFVETLGERSVCLLLGHGMTAVGRTVEGATSVSLNLYELARMNYVAYAIDKPRPVPDLNEDVRQSHARVAERRARAGALRTEPSEGRWQRSGGSARAAPRVSRSDAGVGPPSGSFLNGPVCRFVRRVRRLHVHGLPLQYE